MSDEPSVIQLVTEVLDSGRTPEDVCSNCPHQLEEVRRRVARCRQLDFCLDDLFSPSELTTNSEESSAAARLPQIPLYHVQAIIGEGGMGVVYSAQHLKLKRTVAVKMLRSGAYASPAELGRFSLEAETVAGLQHPHIVQIHDLGEVDGRPYFTMEYLDGGSLAQKLNGVPLPPEQAVRYLITMASAVDAAHRAGIVHRDLKPANVLFTLEGELKISDFGLARRISTDDGLTYGGARLGTPSYMAPEQAAGRTVPVGPSADIYALGAILYEMLTGRPPFKGASAADTERQVINDDPAAPRRLNTSVPRDLETICLKCLRKDPVQRYATAADLAADADRCLRGEPIHARPTGYTERAAKWVRRHKAATFAIAAGVVAATTILIATAWAISQRMAIASAAAAELKNAETLQKQADWTGADEALDRAAIRLGSNGPAALRAELQQDRSESQLVARLEQIREKNEGDDRSFDRLNDAYARAFQDAGLGGENDPPALVARRIGAMNVSPALIVALDDWTTCLNSGNRLDWVLGVLQLADPDPTGLRNHVRDPAVWNDPNLAVHLTEMNLTNQPVSFIIALAKQVLKQSDGRAIMLLLPLQRANPRDFWVNITLGGALRASDPNAARAFDQAAVSIRPNSALAHDNLGESLQDCGHAEEAMLEFRRSVELDPDADASVANLSGGLRMHGQTKEAMDLLAAALKHSGPYPYVHREYASQLLEARRPADALDQFRQSAASVPPDWATRQGMRRCLVQLGRSDEMLADWRKEMAAAPASEDAYDGYAEYALFTGQQAEYERIRRLLLDKYGESRDSMVCTRVAIACLLAPISGKDLATVSAMTERSVASQPNQAVWSFNYFQFGKALALYRQGRYSEAMVILSQVGAHSFPTAARAITVMVHQQVGDLPGALKEMDMEALGLNWSANAADEKEFWMCHALRREAEKAVLPDMPAFLQGRYQPASNDERIAMTAELQFEGRNLARGKLWRETLGTQSNPPVGYRFRAASTAALISAGVGVDVTGLSTADRAQWRADALEWLQADLDRLEHGSSNAQQIAIHRELGLWLTDVDLANVRGNQPAFTAEESSQWNALWERVQSLYDHTK